MTTEYFAIAATVTVTVACSIPLGRYLYCVFSERRTWLDPALVPLERLVLRATGQADVTEQTWQRYAISLLVSNLVMWVVTFPHRVVAERPAA